MVFEHSRKFFLVVILHPIPTWLLPWREHLPTMIRESRFDPLFGRAVCENELCIWVCCKHVHKQFSARGVHQKILVVVPSAWKHRCQSCFACRVPNWNFGEAAKNACKTVIRIIKVLPFQPN